MKTAFSHSIGALTLGMFSLLSGGLHAAIAANLSFTELLDNLRHAPQDVRIELAEIALDELALAYRDEADKARADSRQQPDNLDLARWSAAVEALANNLDRTARTTAYATSVDW